MTCSLSSGNRMNSLNVVLALLCLVFASLEVVAFVRSSRRPRTATSTKYISVPKTNDHNIKSTISLYEAKPNKEQETETEVIVKAQLEDDKVTALFAWISRAFAGDPQYNNLMLAIAAIFGNLPQNSLPVQMSKQALELLPKEEELVGDTFSIEEREYNSLGAMGAGQWMGQYKTRPHALLILDNVTSVDDWMKTLPRGCRRSIQRSLQQNFTVTTKHIMGNQPAPHSSLAHFRCVVAHEVRLLSNMYGQEAFFDALAEAVSRYIGTTRMTGDIREYRNTTTNQVIAIAHEVRKGKTIRGQWFYANDDAAKNYVWFHSVYSLVERGLQADGVTCLDLGPSGSDAFSELKARYGFQSYDDWPNVADYSGNFWYCDESRPRSDIDRRRRFSWF